MKRIAILLLCMMIPVFAAETNKKVLLAMEATGFKKALIKEMKSILEGEGATVTVVSDHKKSLKDQKAADYDAVFITVSGVNSQIRPWIKSWLDANKTEGEKILVHVTKTKKWKTVLDVDAVSSASAKKEVTPLAKEYVVKILEKATAKAE